MGNLLSYPITITYNRHCRNILNPLIVKRLPLYRALVDNMWLFLSFAKYLLPPDAFNEKTGSHVSITFHNRRGGCETISILLFPLFSLCVFVFPMALFSRRTAETRRFWCHSFLGPYRTSLLLGLAWTFCCFSQMTKSLLPGGELGLI